MGDVSVLPSRERSSRTTESSMAQEEPTKTEETIKPSDPMYDDEDGWDPPDVIVEHEGGSMHVAFIDQQGRDIHIIAHDNEWETVYPDMEQDIMWYVPTSINVVDDAESSGDEDEKEKMYYVQFGQNARIDPTEREEELPRSPWTQAIQHHEQSIYSLRECGSIGRTWDLSIEEKHHPNRGDEGSDLRTIETSKVFGSMVLLTDQGDVLDEEKDSVDFIVSPTEDLGPSYGLKTMLGDFCPVDTTVEAPALVVDETLQHVQPSLHEESRSSYNDLEEEEVQVSRPCLKRPIYESAPDLKYLENHPRSKQRVTNEENWLPRTRSRKTLHRSLEDGTANLGDDDGEWQDDAEEVEGLERWVQSEPSTPTSMKPHRTSSNLEETLVYRISHLLPQDKLTGVIRIINPSKKICDDQQEILIDLSSLPQSKMLELYQYVEGCLREVCDVTEKKQRRWRRRRKNNCHPKTEPLLSKRGRSAKCFPRIPPSKEELIKKELLRPHQENDSEAEIDILGL